MIFQVKRNGELYAETRTNFPRTATVNKPTKIHKVTGTQTQDKKKNQNTDKRTLSQRDLHVFGALM